MKYIVLFIGILLLQSQLASAQVSAFPKGEKAPNVHHTGDVWLNHLARADENFDFNVVFATFAPGAKLNWHIHPKGQQLYITKGSGYYQEKGKEVRVVRTGDVIKCAPGVEHWHAATPDDKFAYLAITMNEPTKWTEEVSQDYYDDILVPSTEANTEEEIKALSRKKWEWMAEKNADSLSVLFHDKARFVHMGGTWGKDREVDIIRSGGIHYKKADVHEVMVEVIGDTAILWNRITLLAVVGGNEVSNPFMVTEVYKKQDDQWKLANLSFSRLLSND